MKIAILGYGRQGMSSYNYFKKLGHEVVIHDLNTSLILPEGASSVLGAEYINNLSSYDLIIRSPKIHSLDIVKANSEEILNKVTSNTNEFLRVCPTKNVIGITGTKGKGTTSTLVTELLKQAGFKVHLGGNIGTPPLDLLNDSISESDWIVLELANFQTIDLRYSPHIGVCLMIEPEHLDWHDTYDDYMQAKAQLFKFQTEQDVAIYFGQNPRSKEIASAGKANLIPYFIEPGATIKDGWVEIEGNKIIETKDVKLIGEHNLQNICAALTILWQIKEDSSAANKVFSSFTNLPFRLEMRKDVDGVKFYNDSFSSNPIATMAALESIKGNKVLILGGKDRGLDLKDLMDSISKHSNEIKKIVVIGEAGNRILENLNQIGFGNYTKLENVNMDAIVNFSKENTAPGDSIILSPGFPSFDMFVDFEDRGKQFNRTVDAL